MRSSLSETFFIFAGCISALFSGNASAQPAADLVRFQQKYPETPVVYELEQKDISVEIKKSRPVIKTKEFSSRFILQNNTGLNNYKYYFDAIHQVKGINAYSLVPEGDKYRKVPVTDFVKTAEIDDGIFYDDDVAYSFIFSSAGKGTQLVVESEMEITDPYCSFSFTFARHSPVEKSRVTITIPDNVKIKYRLFGGPDTASIKFTSTLSGNKTLYVWEATDMRGFEEDELAPDLYYFIPHLIIQITGYETDGHFVPLIGTLDDLYHYCYRCLRDTIPSVNGKIKKLGDSLTAGKTLPEEKVNAIYQWIQTKIRYVAIEDGKNGVVPCDAELVLQRMYGDCKGKTSLLVNLLRSQNLRISYAWVGTRSVPYQISGFPSRCCFDHMVAVWWNDKNEPVILDGTTRFHSLYEIPAFIQGKECLIDKGPDDYLLYKIPVAAPSVNTCLDSLQITIDGETLKGNGIATYNGERKADQLYSFCSVDTSHYKGIVNSELPKASNKFIIHSVNISDPAMTNQPFRVDYSFSIPDYLTTGKDRLYVNLNLDRFPGNTSVEDDRVMPIEAEQTFDNIFSCTLKIPDSYNPEKIPEMSSFSNPEFGFTQQYQLRNDSLTLTTRVYFDFQVISGEKIKRFAEMLSALQRVYSKSIVLIKK